MDKQLTEKQIALLERYQKAVNYCLPKFGNLINQNGIHIERVFVEDEPARKAWYDIQEQMSEYISDEIFMSELNKI